ncbi:response regulator [Dechloromonas sp. A34]|uniref:response regulator n=1 Tax=Dechloromonas sp. A34 TaxID=447588 RepID=UPI0022498F99|nr:response regulator [Dechloromonas sp. A34]
MPASSFSLSSRLWLVLTLAILPLVMLTLVDYRSERLAAIADIEHRARLMLQASQVSEDASLRQVRQLLRIMAAADDMKNLDPASCTGLVARLLQSAENFSNLGAVLPNGDVFCSARPSDRQVNVADRTWFREARSAQDITHGEFVLGRISGKPGVVFGLPMRDTAGHLRATLFIASDITWFDRLTHNFQLPKDWTSTLFHRDGSIVSHHPDPDIWRGASLDEKNRSRLVNALRDGLGSIVLNDIDGIERLFVLSRLQMAGEELVVSIGAPVQHTLAVIDRSYSLRLALLVAVTLLSILLARYYLYRLIERWVGRLEAATEKVASGDFSARISNSKTPRELGRLDQHFNSMAAALEQRAEQYADDRIAIETLNGLLADKVAALEAGEQDLRRLSTAVEQSPTSIVITDTEPRIIYVNQAFTRTSGYTAEEVIGENPRILQSGETDQATFHSMWESLTSGAIWRGELRNKRKDGSLYTELAIISPVRQSDGRISQYVAIKEDITERRRIEDELASYRHHLEQLVDLRTNELALAKEAAEAANRAKSDFLANMSHEIRTPMNAIIGLAYLLSRTPLSNEQSEKLNKVSDAAQHLLQLINDILDLSKIEAGKIVLDNQTFDPADIVHSVAGVIRDQAVGKNLEVVVDTRELPALAQGDATRLRQVLLNFASNALKFTAHGSITLSGKLEAMDGDAMICRFAVADTGIGIEPTDLPRLFNPFEQLDASTTRRFGGTGLGLAIARHLAELMGGRVGVSSTPGAGSTFWISARLAAPSGEPIARQAPLLAEAKDLHGCVLLVEDEAINREIGCAILEAAGLRVITADNGQEAIERFTEGGADLILMDIRMPILDGLEATRRIRALPGGAVIPIVALTANAYLEDMARCLEAGMNDFLAKPVEPEALYTVLGKYLSSGGCPRRLNRWPVPGRT